MQNSEGAKKHMREHCKAETDLKANFVKIISMKILGTRSNHLMYVHLTCEGSELKRSSQSEMVMEDFSQNDTHKFIAT